MYAGQKHLDNLCVLVDHNNGQLDTCTRAWFFPCRSWKPFSLFRLAGAHSGRNPIRWRVSRRWRASVSGPAMVSRQRLFVIAQGLRRFFRFSEPAQGGGTDSLIGQEYSLQSEQRGARVRGVCAIIASGWRAAPKARQTRDLLLEAARRMHLEHRPDSPRGEMSLRLWPGANGARSCARQAHSLRRQLLPQLDRKKEYAASDIVTGAMKAFAGTRRRLDRR